MRLRIPAVVLTVLLLVVPFVVYAQAPQPTLFVTNIDTTQFPQTNVYVATRNFPQPFDQVAVTLYEDDMPMQNVTSTPMEVGVQVAVLVDASTSILLPGLSGRVRLDEVRESVQRMIDMQTLSPETDWLAAYAPSGREITIVQDWTRDHQAVANALVQYENPGDSNAFTPLFNLLFFVLDHFSSPDIPDYLNKVIIVYSDGLSGKSSLDLNDAVNRAIAMNIPIHTVQLGANAQGRNNLERLAILTGGRFVQYDSPQATDAIWRTLAEERTQYLLSYRSPSASPREIRLEATLPSGEQVRAVRPFPAVSVAPVRVTLVTPGPGLFIQKVAQTYDQPLEEVEPRELEIQVAFEWPDGQPRAIRRVEYIVDGRTEVRTEEPFDRIVFPITDLDTGMHTLRVIAIDELGLKGESEPLTFEVDVYRPEPPPPSVTLFTWGDRTITIRRDMLNLIANAAAILLGVLAVVFALRSPERRARVTRTLTVLGQTVTQTLLGRNMQPRAYLVVLSRGDGTRPKKDTVPVSKDEVRIGRDPNNADLLLDDPYVSRRHAILRWDGEAKAYFLLEDGGRSGTFVEGERLQTGQSVRLASGDSIELGQVQFRFYYADDLPSGDEDQGMTKPQTDVRFKQRHDDDFSDADVYDDFDRPFSEEYDDPDKTRVQR